jgi:hypothetical protein
VCHFFCNTTNVLKDRNIFGKSMDNLCINSNVGIHWIVLLQENKMITDSISSDLKLSTTLRIGWCAKFDNQHHWKLAHCHWNSIESLGYIQLLQLDDRSPIPHNQASRQSMACQAYMSLCNQHLFNGCQQGKVNWQWGQNGITMVCCSKKTKPIGV